MSTPIFTVLVAARKNSKYLAKFLAGLVYYSDLSIPFEVMVMTNKYDSWNVEILEAMRTAYQSANIDLNIFMEDKGLGRGGLHQYYNDMLPGAKGQWIIYFCEDHFFTGKAAWNTQIMNYIHGRWRSGDSQAKDFPLNPDEPWVIVPQFDNAGSMNHVVSRGFVKAMDGKIGSHGWIDSYINDLMHHFQHRVIRMDPPELFHDFTHDVPSPMDESHARTKLSEEGKKLPKHNSEQYHQMIEVSKLDIKQALGGLDAYQDSQQN